MVTIRGKLSEFALTKSFITSFFVITKTIIVRDSSVQPNIIVNVAEYSNIELCLSK